MGSKPINLADADHAEGMIFVGYGKGVAHWTNYRPDGPMLRFAVETDEVTGIVGRVVLLALRGEKGQVECT